MCAILSSINRYVFKADILIEVRTFQPNNADIGNSNLKMLFPTQFKLRSS